MTDLSDLLQGLTEPNLAFTRLYPGEPPRRQPVHTMYGGAHLFTAELAANVRKKALESYREFLPDAPTLKKVFSLPSDELARTIHARVGERLERQAVEDFRVDFEDGFGVRPDAEEDSTAVAAAKAMAQGARAGTLPPFIGIRIKALSEELKARSLRTLDLFLTTLGKESGGQLPAGFCVTLSKITHRRQIEALARALDRIEKTAGFAAGAIAVELMIETPASLFDTDGQVVSLRFLESGRGRIRGAHFGVYDYTASLNVTADQQRMDHPGCDFARHVLQVSLAGTGVWISDGATNVMPVGDRDSVHRAQRLAYDHTRHSLTCGYYQGWDLHPAQLPVRYIALYAFFLEGLPAAAARLKKFVEVAAKATLLGNVFDDAATGQGLLNSFLRAESCGAIPESEILQTGLTLDEIRTRSFKKILELRAARS